MTKTYAFFNQLQVSADSESYDEEAPVWPEVTIEENGNVFTITFPQHQTLFV